MAGSGIVGALLVMVMAPVWEKPSIATGTVLVGPPALLKVPEAKLNSKVLDPLTIEMESDPPGPLPLLEKKVLEPRFALARKLTCGTVAKPVRKVGTTRVNDGNGCAVVLPQGKQKAEVALNV